MMTIPRIRFRHPRRNLTGASRCITAEDRFTLGFARAYIGSIGSGHPGNADSGMSYAREIPTARFGITDFVAVSWRAMSPSGKTVRAFEMKLTDWRKAILQAHRYRYFADVAVVVLPKAKLHLAATRLATFRALSVGLWGFCQESGRIVKLFTPRPKTPLAPEWKPHVITLVSRVSKSIFRHNV